MSFLISPITTDQRFEDRSTRYETTLTIIAKEMEPTALMTRLNAASELVMESRISWNDRVMSATRTTLTAPVAAGLADPATQNITVASNSGFRVGDLIVIDARISERMVITAVNIDGVTLTVIRGFGGTDHLQTYLAADTVQRIGLLTKEKSSGADVGSETGEKRENYFWKPQVNYGLSGTDMNTDHWGDLPALRKMVLEQSYAAEQQMRDFNYMLWHGVRKDGSPSVFGSMDGVIQMVTRANPAAVVDHLGNTLTLSRIADVVSRITERGGRPTAIFANPDRFRALQAEASTYIQTTQTETILGNVITTVLTFQGVSLALFGDRQLLPGQAVFCDPARIQPVYKRRWNVRAVPQTKEDSVEEQLLAELSLQGRNMGEYCEVLYNVG